MTISRISIEWQSIRGSLGTVGHLYLVARTPSQEDGEGYAISGYPEGKSTGTADFDGDDRLEVNEAFDLTNQKFSSLNSGYGAELTDTIDQYGPNDTEQTRGSIDLTAAIQAVHGGSVDLDNIWLQMVSLAQELSDSQYTYDLTPEYALGYMVNSNSLAASALSKIGLNVEDVSSSLPVVGYPS